MDTIVQTDAFFAGKPQAWAAFDALYAQLCGHYPDTQVRVMKTCIVLEDSKPYCYISFPPKKSMDGLLVTISFRQRIDHPRIYMVVPVSKKRFTVHIHLQNEEQIDEELLALIAASRR